MLTRAHPQVNMGLLANRINPREGELRAARTHLLTVRRRLASSFQVSKGVPIGSHSRGSAIRWYSDVDIMVVLRRNEAKWGGDVIASTTLLRKVRDDLQDRYVRTSVRRDEQAVVVRFAEGQQSLDVVPALFSRFEGLRPAYAIPDGYGGWVESSPEAHNRFIRVAGIKSGGKLRKVSQLLKWWKFSRAQPIPIQSFHLDLLLAVSGTCNGVKPYTQCLQEAFQVLYTREGRSLRDPLGISGEVPAAQSENQKEEINSAVGFALVHAQAAVAAERVGRVEESNRQWSIVFNGQF
jgi:hypothetical protein